MTLPQTTAVDQAVRVVALRHQFSTDLVRVPSEALHLRWRCEAAADSGPQIGYQIRCRPTNAEPDQWTVSDPVESAESLGIPCPLTPLAPRQALTVQVRIATARGWSQWSPELAVEGAAVDDLRAIFVTTPTETAGRCPVFTTSFALPAGVESGRLLISSLGIHEARLNGHPVTDSVLNPGYTSYDRRLILDTVDVTDLLEPGINRLDIAVADGWYRGRYGLWDKSNNYGDDLAALAQVEVRIGESWDVVAASDTSWKAHLGPVTSASLYDGTNTDFTLADVPVPVSALAVDTAILAPRSGPLVRPVATFPLENTSVNGRGRLSAPQNISGWVRLTVEGKAGDTVTIRHAEIIAEDGSLYLSALRSARATDTYRLGADGICVLEPSFTFHGFQFAEVETGATVLKAEAVAISSATIPRGTFTCSNELLTRFHDNVRWSQLDNFVSIPTDCPQRDERLGWTGDAQAFAPAACTLFDSESFWASWLIDVALDQGADGAVASVVPNVLEKDGLRMNNEPVEHMGRAGWGDAAAIIPVEVFRSYGDRFVLEQQLDSMRRWVEYLRGKEGRDHLLPEEDFQYSDWLDPDAPTGRPWEAKVSARYIANAFYVYSARMLAAAEAELGNSLRAQQAEELARQTGEATWNRWQQDIFTTQTGAALGIRFGIVPQAFLPQVAEKLAELVRKNHGRIATGFLGTPHILDALSSTGHLEEAYQMLLCTSVPSWLYQVTMGATTVWERWDGILPDGSLNRGEMDGRADDTMISYNHYAYGAIIDWVYRTVGGISAASPGYRRTRIAPRPATDLRCAATSVTTNYGELSLRWKLAESLELELVVPFGIEAELDLPLTASSLVSVNGTAWEGARLGPGTYRLAVSDPLVISPAKA